MNIKKQAINKIKINDITNESYYIDYYFVPIYFHWLKDIFLKDRIHTHVKFLEWNGDNYVHYIVLVPWLLYSVKRDNTFLTSGRYYEMLL